MAASLAISPRLERDAYQSGRSCGGLRGSATGGRCRGPRRLIGRGDAWLDALGLQPNDITLKFPLVKEKTKMVAGVWGAGGGASLLPGSRLQTSHRLFKALQIMWLIKGRRRPFPLGRRF